MSNKLDINSIFDRLYNYFGVKTKSALALKMGVGQPSVSKWHKHKMYEPIRKRCKELGIYDKIFLDFDQKLEKIYDKMNENELAITNSSAAKYTINFGLRLVDKFGFAFLPLFDNVVDKLENEKDVQKFVEYLLDFKH